MTEATPRRGGVAGPTRVLLVSLVGPTGRLDLGVPADATVRELIDAVGTLIGLVHDDPDAQAASATDTPDPEVAVRAPERPPSPWAPGADDVTAEPPSRWEAGRPVELDTTLGTAGVLDGDELLCRWPAGSDTPGGDVERRGSAEDCGRRGGPSR